MTEPPALILEGVKKRFGLLDVIRGVDLTVNRGDRHALIGPNGAGKTTVVGMISGLTRPSSGRILFEGTRIDRLRAERISRLGLARSFQITRIFKRLSAFENIRIGILARRGVRLDAMRSINLDRRLTEETETLIGTIGLTARMHVLAGALTYSEQRALDLGLALASEPKLIILDEPTAGMAKEESDRAVALIRALTADRTLLIVEHDLDVVFRLCNRISVLASGTILATGHPDEIRRNREVQVAYLGSGYAA